MLMNWHTNPSGVIAAFRETFGDNFRTMQPLAKYTSARVGGSAELFVTATSAELLQRAVSMAHAAGLPWFILGGGSNILVADAGVSGLVILNRARATHFRSTGFSVVCSAEAGVNFSGLARQCISKGLGGLEWAIGIPGTVGGAVVGNAGAFGSDMATNVRTVTVWSPQAGTEVINCAAMAYAYRTSGLKRLPAGQKKVVLSAELELKPEPVEVLTARADAFNTRRRQTQPPGATMGSMFKNPEHYFAGYLIEAAGLKGFRIGGASISELHANFFVNDKDASAEDIRELLAEAWNSVRDQFGVELEPEVELVGDWPFDVTESRDRDHVDDRSARQWPH
jgi:UDP-N-acetylmuramate dehydrogenase